MKKLISAGLLLFSVIIITACATKKECNCAKFKSGKYTMGDESAKYQYYIVRNDSTQKEIDVKKGEIAEFKIVWVSDCKYILTIKDGNKKLMDFYKAKQLIITIIDTYADSYKYSAEMKGMKTLYGVMKKIN